VQRFVERWYDEDGVALDVFFDPELARFDVVSRGLVVFSHGAFVEVLRWCLRDEATPDDGQPLGIELSPWEPE
jgi:hypothetical protein